MAMLDRLREFYRTLANDPEKATRFSDDDHRVAAAGLLVHVSKADGEAMNIEHDRLEEMLTAQFELSPREARALIEAADRRDDEEIDFQAFTAIVNRSYSTSDRRQLLEMMWDMAFADGIVHPFEDDAVFRVGALLEIPERDVLAVRKQVADIYGLTISDRTE